MGWTRYHVGTSTPASSDAAGIMASLATLFAVSNDVDTGAAVSGLTWTRDTTAGSQAIYSSAFGPNNYRIIIACHDSGSPVSGPTMIASADTYTAANVMIGLCVNAAGAYVNWYAAAPFSGCSFPGYYRVVPTALATAGEIRAWVSTRDLWLQFRTGTTNIYTTHFGAILAAASTYAESDGYRYGGMVSGIADMNSGWRFVQASVMPAPAFLGYNGSSNGNSHAGVCSVGGATWQTIRFEHCRSAASTTDMAKWAAGVAANTGISFQRASSPEYSVGWWAGISDGPKGITASVVNDSTPALWGWLLSSTYTGAGEDTVIIRKTVP